MKFCLDQLVYLWPEGEERRALAIHEEQLAGEDLAAARVVVDATGEGASGVVDREAVGALEAVGAFRVAGELEQGREPVLDPATAAPFLASPGWRSPKSSRRGAGAHR
jgi:hypothetical protein